MNQSRRSFTKLAAAALPVLTQTLWTAAQPTQHNKSFFKGVQLGVQTYSFHEIPNDGAGHAEEIIRDLLACGIYDCELFGGPVTPGIYSGARPDPALCPKPLLGCAPGKGGSMRNPWAWVFARKIDEDLKTARARQTHFWETVPMSYFERYRAKFDAAGINIHAFNPILSEAFVEDITDLEVDRLFLGAKALRVKAVNMAPRLSVLKRFVPAAEKHGIMLAVHGHSKTWDPEEFSNEASFERAFALSPIVGANLDIGHYAASGGDPVAFIEKHHARISNLHIKDRQRNKPGVNEETGNNVPWGQGDTPIKAVLKLLQRKHYNVPAFVEYEYAGTSEPVEEVKKQYEMCKKMLA
ncbi:MULTISPECIES: sugar phosphate isomerase/epimerase [Acidobacteriaceae]|uniref:sugar phosphate isomerase/epimerase family protein n=1 Tax=Acidobacteriaceae TaxID=204434 RepID=UPI00131EA07B|nr:MULTISPECIES: sugar phosphate isomerase/epimerase [Acidobacteriaceae]MDW5266951.1 sugar phosphate isomerase/epimerase [Edaphobacter sp.]